MPLPSRLPRSGWLFAAAFLALVAALLPLGVRGQEEQAPEGPPKYVGIGRCASAACHGRDAHPVWQERDRHSAAFEVLFNQRSRTMAGILGIDSPEASESCLVCHSVWAPPELREGGFDLSQGVGCEGCHGPASQWRSLHTDESVDRERLYQLGMYPTKDLARRSRLCVSCHLGDAERSVGHDLIAAGHPELTFEVDTFTSRMPPHWDPQRGDWQGARAWALGQAAALAESMRLLAARLEAPSWNGWPDFADFECSSCHHPYPSLRRQRRGYEGKPGLPPAHPARWTVLARFLEATLPSQRRELETRLDALRDNLESLGRDRGPARGAALDLARFADGLGERFQRIEIGARQVQAAVKAISEGAGAIAERGFSSAVQAKWAADALAASHRESGGADPGLDQWIAQLETTLRSRFPSAFAESSGGTR